MRRATVRAPGAPVVRVRRTAGLATVAGLLALLSGCDDAALDGTVEPTVPFSVQPEATDPPFPTVEGEGPSRATLLAHVQSAVMGTLGITLELADDRCIADRLEDTLDDDDVAELALDEVIGEQPIEVQNDVFAAFDRCVDAARYADLLAPVLVIAGAAQEGARCVFGTMRSTLGFAGMYRYAAGESGELDRDDTFVRAMRLIFDGCEVDPEQLAPPTTPAPPTTAGPATSLGGGSSPATTVQPASASETSAAITTTETPEATESTDPTDTTGA